MEQYDYPVPEYGTQNSRGFSRIGLWLTETFEVIKKNVETIVIFLYVVPTLAAMPVFFAVIFLASDLEYNQVTDSLEGFSFYRFFLLGLAVVVWLIVDLLAALAANHQFYYSSVGKKVSLQESIAKAIQNLPRAIGWNLLIYVLPVLGIFLLTTAGFWFGFPAVAIFPIIPIIIASAWALIRLNFLDAALALAPRGVNIFSVSWDITKNVFWALLGRIIIISIIGGLLVFGVELVLGSVYSPDQSWIPNVEFDPEGGILLDGKLLSDLEVIAIKDFLPSGSSIFLLSLVGGISGALQLALTAPSMIVLYRQLDGAVEE